MSERVCIQCGMTMPKIPWWKHALALGMTGPPFHDPRGPDADSCWRLFCQRMGIRDPGTRPTR